ncbi:MAG: DUF885 family protein [bacterium]
MKQAALPLLTATTLFLAVPFGLLAEAPPDAVLPQLITQFAADRQDVMNATDLPGAPLRFDHLNSLYTQWLTRLRAVDFDSLPPSGKVDTILLRNELECGLDDIAFERKEWAEMDSVLAFRSLLYTLEQARWEGTQLDSREAAARVSELAKQIKDLKVRVELGLNIAPSNSTAATHSSTGPPLKVTAPLANKAAAAATLLRGTLKSWFAFYDGFNPEFSWWLRKPYEEADKAIEDYIKVLRENAAGIKGKDDDPLVGQPVGEAAVATALRREFLPYDARALLFLGEREMTWCEKAMKVEARAMGCGDDWKSALTRVKADFVAPGAQDSLIRETALSAVRFCQDHKLVTTPPLCEETWRLTMMPPETLKTIPYAAYNGQTMMIAYARDDMNHEDKLMTMRGNNRHFMRTVTPHELIPGHHLQRFQATRHQPHRALFSTPFYVEGWAHYGERRFWDLGWATTPEDRLGMLFWRINRAARVVVALQFHLGKMTPPDMVDFLVNRVGHERLGATAEVRRFIGDGFPPLYPAAYTLGALQLEALHHEVVGSGKMTEQAFHDAVLFEGAIPIELVRARLLNLPLTRDTRSTWRFAGEAGQP